MSHGISKDELSSAYLMMLSGEQNVNSNYDSHQNLEQKHA